MVGEGRGGRGGVRGGVTKTILHLGIFLFISSLLKEAPHKIWPYMAKQFQRR